MKRIANFARRLNVSLDLDSKLIVKKENSYFLLNPRLKELVLEGFFHAGTYLGKIEKGNFVPSFDLLAMIAKSQKANKVFVNEKTEWLFICGRNILKQGIRQTNGSRRKGSYVLVLNEHSECLGFGKIANDLDKTNGKQDIAVRNVLDIGDFLRREH